MENKAIFPVIGMVVLCIVAYVLVTSETPEQQHKVPSDIQVVACNAADDGGTCYTTLRELGIVTPEECCRSLGKCCV